MKTLTGRKILALSAGALVAFAMTTGPATAESRASHTLASRRVHHSKVRYNRHHNRRRHHNRHNRHNRYHRTYRQWGHHNVHVHSSACYGQWVSDGYDVVTERVWMAAAYEETVIPWKVEWTWHAAHGYDAHPTAITDNPHSSPPRPNVHQYGTGNWEKRILQQRQVSKQWVPAHWDTVERKVHRPGYYTYACGF